MKKLILTTTAVVGFILTPAAFACGGCPYSAAKKLQTARADSADCAVSAKTLQVAKADSADCAGKQATQAALAYGSDCSAKKAVQVAYADGAPCASKAKTQKVALADSSACAASSKAIKVAQKSGREFGCDGKAQNIVLAKVDAKASGDCGGCPKAGVAPAVTKSNDSAPVVVAAKE